MPLEAARSRDLSVVGLSRSQLRPLRVLRLDLLNHRLEVEVEGGLELLQLVGQLRVLLRDVNGALDPLVPQVNLPLGQPVQGLLDVQV